MRSTFKVLFYVNGSKEKNGIVPIMGRVTINGSVAQFSCKQSIHKDLWDVKGNRAKGKSKESRDINLALDNIKAQIIKHYQRILTEKNSVQTDSIIDSPICTQFLFLLFLRIIIIGQTRNCTPSRNVILPTAIYWSDMTTNLC